VDRERFAVVIAPVVVVLWLMIGSPAALAAQLFASPGGTGSTCTDGTPCSLPTAVSNAAAGDEVLVAPGSYGTPAAPLTTSLSVGVGDVDIHGVDTAQGAPGATIYTSASYGVSLYDAPGDEISDLTIDDSGSQGAAISLKGDTADRMTFIAGPGESGCVLGGASTVTNSVCESAGDWAVAVYSPLTGGASTDTLRNVDAIATATSGVGLYVFSVDTSGETSTVNMFNSIVRGGSADIQTGESGGTTPLVPATVTTSHSNYGLAHSTVMAGGSVTDDGTSQTTGVQTPAQLFVDEAANDFQEAPGAQTIGAGAVSAVSGTYDALGYPRLFDAGGSCVNADIGADAFVPAATPTLAGLTATVGGETTATLSGTADPLGGPGSVQFEYAPAGAGGTAPATYSSTPEECLALGSAAQPVTAALSGLTPGTTYFYRLVGTNSDGATVPAFTSTFTTTAAPTTTTTTTTTTQPPATTSQSTTKSFGDQRVTLVSPSSKACLASNNALRVTLSSAEIAHSKAAKLKFSRAAFFLDKGVKHVARRTVKAHGGHKTTTVITYTANATARRAPANLTFKLTGLKAGTHTLSVKLYYSESVTRHNHRTTVTVAKTLTAKFLIC
jgi:hypothetical protein